MSEKRQPVYVTLDGNGAATRVPYVFTEIAAIDATNNVVADEYSSINQDLKSKAEPK